MYKFLTIKSIIPNYEHFVNLNAAFRYMHQTFVSEL